MPCSAFDIIESYHLFPIQDFLLHPFKNNSGKFLTSCWCEVILHQEQSPQPPTQPRHRADTVSSSAFYGFTPPSAPHIKLRARLSHTQHNLTLYPRLTSKRLHRAKPQRVAMRIIIHLHRMTSACIIVIVIIFIITVIIIIIIIIINHTL
jgi:hypothetical protein